MLAPESYKNVPEQNALSLFRMLKCSYTDFEKLIIYSPTRSPSSRFHIRPRFPALEHVVAKARTWHYAPVICNHGPHGAGDSGDIAGLKCHILTSASSPQCGGTAGLLIPCQTCRGNFLFTCRYLSRAFHRALTIDMSPQCWAYTRALHRQKSISPLFPGPQGPWLQMTGALWVRSYGQEFLS